MFLAQISSAISTITRYLLLLAIAEPDLLADFSTAPADGPFICTK